MRSRSIVLALLAASLAAAPASQPATTTTSPARRALGQVLGRTIYAEDIGVTGRVPPDIQFDARDQHWWGQMEAVSHAFGGPIIERFKAQTDVKATDEERKKFGHFMFVSQQRRPPIIEQRVADLEKRLADESLKPESCAELQEQLQTWRRGLGFARDSAKQSEQHWADNADSMIESWKFQRNLRRKYGGRIIFQQFGPEALDDMRKLFEDAEKAGDLRIDDPGVRHLFYYYYNNMGHADAGDDTVLEIPWFLRDPTTRPVE